MVTNWICLLFMPAFYKKALARESYHYHRIKIQRSSEQYILSHPDYIKQLPVGPGVLFWVKYVIFASLF